jgi:NADH dehydrogenase
MKKIVIVGGGFAGLWAALGAAQQAMENEADIQITLISKDSFLNVRPRLYESNPESLRTPLGPILDPIGVRFVEGVVRAIDSKRQTVEVIYEKDNVFHINFDRLILATGSEIKTPPVPGLAEYGWNIDTYDAAVALDQHMSTMLQAPDSTGHNTFVIIGAGFTGIELATEMRERIAVHANADTAANARIILVERAAMVGPDLGSNPRPAVEAALHDSNIETKLETFVDAVTSDAITLGNGETIDTKTVISTVGLQANQLNKKLPVEHDELGRMVTADDLRVKGATNIFAAGDSAHVYVDDEHLALMSCQHAMTMGKFAGHNAVRDLLELPLYQYRQPVYLTCIDLGQSGALFTSGWDRQIQKSGEEGKALKRQINTQWIYPPVGTREQILETAGVDV